MKRRTFLVCSAALFCGAFLAGGCTPKTSQPVLQQIEYSNLADSDTQALLSKLLQDADVSDLRIQTFFDHVQKFNNAVDPAWLTTGFENAKPSDLKYDPYSMQDAWTEKYDTFPGWNCRITACGLFGDFITVTGKADLDSAEDTLFMDYETLDSDPYQCNRITDALAAAGIKFYCKSKDVNRHNTFDQARIGTLGIKPRYVTEVFVDKENADMALHIIHTLS